MPGSKKGDRPEKHYPRSVECQAGETAENHPQIHENKYREYERIAVHLLHHLSEML